MAAALLFRLRSALQRLENTLFGPLFPSEDLLIAGAAYNPTRISDRWSLGTLLDDNGFLWAVPKSRRTVERRMQRKFGHPDYIWKPHRPKTNLITCNTCGHHHEPHVLCACCYARVREETTAMQEEIQKQLGLSPVEEEVIVLYKGEKEEKPQEFWKGKRIVELERERPLWFSKNLLQQSTAEPTDDVSDVKPTGLA